MSNFALDSATVWGRSLSDAELAALYNNDVGLDYPFMGGPFTLVYQASLINDPPTPFVLGSGFQLWTASRSFDSDTRTYSSNMDLLFSGVPSTRGFVWTAYDFLDKILFAQHDNRAQYWTPPLPNLARDLPGLPSDDSNWDGVAVFFSHALLWKDDRLKWSDKDDFTLWLPVDQTVVSAVLNIQTDFIQPAPGGIVSVTVSDTVAQVVSVSLSGDLDFGNVAVGDSAQSILTITNSGTVALNVSGLSLPDGFSGSFSGTIPVNGSVPVVITFSPTESIDYIGTITVASNATTGTTSVPVTGTGTGDTKIISLSGFLSFGSVILGHTLQSSLVIKNTGNQTLNVTGLSLPSGFSGSFSGTIAAGADQIVTITFSPTAKITYGGNITVASDSTSGVSIFPVSGTGVSKLPHAIFLTDNGSLQFGDVEVGNTPTGTLRIYNPGTQTVKIVGIAFPGGFTGSFAGNIAANSFHDVTVTFTPLDGQDYTGIVTVATNVAVSGVTSILISGTGVETGKVINLSGSLDFGGVLIGSSATSILKIANKGTDPLTVTSLTMPTAFTGAFAGTIAPGSFKNVLVTFQPIAATSYSGSIHVNADEDSGTDTIAVSGTGVAIPVPTSLEPGQFVFIQDEQSDLPYYNYYTVVSMSGTSVVLQLLDLTGATPPGDTITQGHQILSVDANESGETRVVGSVNGPIFRVLPQGDYAYIFKERSISSLQYTGLGNGTFFIHPEVSGEGLLGRNAICNINDGRIILLGHKELYQYQGGPNLTPVCQQLTKQLFSELDRTRVHQILLFNNEQRSEVWVSYPATGGGFRVLVWNYVEDSASFDDDLPERMLTGLGLIDWSGDPTWAQFPDSQTWDDLDSALAWSDLVGASQDHLTAMAGADGNLRLWGTRYAREGLGYLALSESIDFDLGDGDAWKYVDVVKLGLRIVSPEPTERLLFLQVGCRADLNDAEITWTDALSVLVNGHAETPVKVNPGGSGRYLRLRMYSQDADVKWAVSSFEIITRMGSTY